MTRTLLTLAVLTLSSVPAAAAPLQNADPSDTIDTVEVIAPRERMRKAIHVFVENVTRFDGLVPERH